MVRFFRTPGVSGRTAVHSDSGRSRTDETEAHHSAAFKAKLALGALRGEKTLVELATHHDEHPNQITSWKKQTLGRAAEIFGSEVAPAVADRADPRSAREVQ